MYIEELEKVLEICEERNWNYLGFVKDKEMRYFVETQSDIRSFSLKDGKPYNIVVHEEKVFEQKKVDSPEILRELIELSNWYKEHNQELEDKFKRYIGEFKELFYPEKPDKNMIKEIILELDNGLRVLRRILREGGIPLKMRKIAAEMIFEIQFIADKNWGIEALPLLIEYRNKAALYIAVFDKILKQ